MTLPDNEPKINPIELSRWQGKVDGTLTNLDTRMGNLEIKVEGLPDLIEKRVEKIINDNSSRRITFQWVVEKVALPFLVGGGSAAAAVYAILKTVGG